MTSADLPPPTSTPQRQRSLQVYINHEHAGTLQESGGTWSFQYSRGWLDNPACYALSPHLPLAAAPLTDGATRRPVQWYFDNLLPEEQQRILLARDAHIDSADSFGLLAWYGHESAGSLTLLPPGVAPLTAASKHVLPAEALGNRIRQMPTIPLTHGAHKRMSLAGAQHKLAILLEPAAPGPAPASLTAGAHSAPTAAPADVLYEPAGAQPSSHILKPNHPHGDYPHSVINEWFVMRLARRLGLPVPDVQRRYLPAPVYLVQRFDRTHTAGGWQRLHAIDACQLLGLDHLFKYSEGSMERLAELAGHCRSPGIARTQLYGWLLFNILTGNTDAHLKNLSFLVHPDGIRLAPFYDLLSVAAYETPAFGQSAWPRQTRLAWPILGKSFIHDIDRPLLLEAAAVLGLGRTAASQQLTQLCRNIVPAAESLYAETGTENAQIVTPDLAPTLAGELRTLRVIIHTIIREMVQRLG